MSRFSEFSADERWILEGALGQFADNEDEAAADAHNRGESVNAAEIHRQAAVARSLMVEATERTACPYIPGSVGAQQHCGHWHAEDPDGSCCWCGSDEDDSGSCPGPASFVDPLDAEIAVVFGEARPTGGWVPGIGWVARMNMLSIGDQYRYDGDGFPGDRPVSVYEELPDEDECDDLVVVVLWADGTDPAPSDDDWSELRRWAEVSLRNALPNPTGDEPLARSVLDLLDDHDRLKARLHDSTWNIHGDDGDDIAD